MTIVIPLRSCDPGITNIEQRPVIRLSTSREARWNDGRVTYCVLACAERRRTGKY